MPFFLILPLWLLAAAVGVVMVSIPRVRRVGVYVLMMSTLAALFSFVVAYGLLLGGALLVPQPAGWFAYLLLAAYLAGIPIGGVIGATAGLVITRKLLPGRRRASVLKRLN
jgi:hypothetical protein